MLFVLQMYKFTRKRFDLRCFRFHLIFIRFNLIFKTFNFLSSLSEVKLTILLTSMGTPGRQIFTQTHFADKRSREIC